MQSKAGVGQFVVYIQIEQLVRTVFFKLEYEYLLDRHILRQRTTVQVLRRGI